MTKITYPISIGSNLLNDPKKWLPKDWGERQLVIITDNIVKKYYGDRLIYALNEGREPLLLSFLTGEKSKNYQTKEYLEDEMLKHHCDRETIILALGGGVVGDMAGFVAATYMRGISYIQIPTTLLAMVDSSVGGKTGIDTAHGKNLIGAFWQPMGVVADIDCLKTLPETHLINGYIEALKMFIINDIESFHEALHHIEKMVQYDIPVLQDIVQKAIRIKTDIVSQDVNEKGLRMVLNFGHTIGHAIEKVTGYTILHGYAVALGILVESKIAQLSGLLTDEEYSIIRLLFSKLNIFGNQLKKINLEMIIHATKNDKKVKDGKVRYILLKKIGQIVEDNSNFSCPIPDDRVRQALLEVSEGTYGG